MKKSTPMLLLERLHPGKTIDQIVREADQQHERPEAAAAALGISYTTFVKWRAKFAEADAVGAAQ